MASGPARRTALVGVLGHVDHGKTALVRALTGADTDRLPEEKARGISIVLGFARLAPPDTGAELDLVDVPGHERFVRTMVAGATAMDAALLCVDAEEGVRAQTAEHAEIAALLGVRRGVVAVTRADRPRAEPEAAAEAARRLLDALGLVDWPAVATSAATGQGVAELAALLGGLAELPKEGEAASAVLPVDRVFALPGIGTVATGALRRGSLSVGDELEILPGGRRARVRGLQVHGTPWERIHPGRRTAVALRGVERSEVAPGDVLAAPGLLVPSPRLDVELRVLRSAPRALDHGASLRMLLGTAERGARLRLLDRTRLEPGEAAIAQLLLDEPLATPAREPFVLRLPSPPRTVGGGLVIHPEPPRRRGRDVLALRALAEATPMEAVALGLRQAGSQGIAAAALARLAGLSPAALAKGLPEAEGVALSTGILLHREALTELEAATLSAVGSHQRADPMGPGMPLEALRQAVPCGQPALDGVVARLVAAGTLALQAGRLRRPELQREALLSPRDRALLAEVEGAFRSGGLSPPDAESVTLGDRRRMAALHALLRLGVLVRAPDAVQKREIVFHREALATARRILRAHFGERPGGFLAGECGRLLGISRRYSIPLLERLDAERFTQRKGDRRVLTGRG